MRRQRRPPTQHRRTRGNLRSHPRSQFSASARRRPLLAFPPPRALAVSRFTYFNSFHCQPLGPPPLRLAPSLLISVGAVSVQGGHGVAAAD